MTDEERISHVRDNKVEGFIKEELDGAAKPRSPWGPLIYSIRRASQSADRLAMRVMWLNVTLVVLGILGLVVAGYGVFCK
jgi:hypothetical protein